MAVYKALTDTLAVLKDGICASGANATTLKDIKDALQNLTEMSVDTGVADATSTVNSLDDTAKSWPVNAFVNLIVEITDGTGSGQLRKISSNTATKLTPTTAFTTAPDATSQYRIAFYGKMASDITHVGGTALTGRDWSLDFKALTDDGIKGILKSLGDVGAGSNIATLLDNIKTAVEKLDDLQNALKSVDSDELITRVTDSAGAEINPAKEDGNLAKLPAQTASGNMPVSIEEAGIQVPADIQSQYKPLLDSTTAALGGSATYTGSSIDVSRYARLTGIIYADQACTLYVDISADGTNWDYSYSEAVGISTGLIISVEAPVPYARLRIVNGAAAQSTLRAYLYGRVI